MNQKSDKWTTNPTTKYDELILGDDESISKYSYALCAVLVRLGSFQYELKKFRESLGINKIYELPKNFRYKELGYWLDSLDLDYSRLLEAGDFICFLYRLPYDWQMPFMCAIVSDFLPIPIELPAIEIYKPNNYLSLAKNNFPTSLSRYPALIIKKNISPTKMRTWILENSDQVRDATNPLYDENLIRNEEKTIIWGAIASQVFIDYPKIDREFVDKCENLAKDINIDLGLPGTNEIFNHKERFEEAIAKSDFLKHSS